MGTPFKSKFFCVPAKHKSEAGKYFVYWKADENVFGITDLEGHVYEQTLDKRTRQTLMKNCGDELLDIKWLAAFKNKAFKIHKMDDAKAEIGYLSGKLSIERSNADPKEIVSNIILKLLEDREELEEYVNTIKTESVDPVKRWIRKAVTTTQDPMNKNRRIRFLPNKPSVSTPEKRVKTEENSQE